MSDVAKEKDMLTVYCMVSIFCHAKHHSNDILCDDCQGLFDYAQKKLQKCPFKAVKPTCSKCRIHCYEPEMRAKIKEVMRFSGPRMICRHPALAVRHIVQMLRSKNAK